MKKVIAIILILSSLNNINSQQEINTEYLRTKTAKFTVVNNQIKGDGLEIIKNILSNSQFVVLGERHNSSQTSKLVTALIPLLKKSNFNNFALEVGPHTVKKLDELSKNSGKTINNLKKFNTTYFNPEIGREPIPFFTGVEDAEFLQSASKNKMKLWGLDQEFYYAALFLIDEIVKLEHSNSEIVKIKNLSNETKKVISNWFIKENKSKKAIDVFSTILKENTVTAFFNLCKSKASLEIIKDLKISWDIYSRWKNDSHVDRVSYMRNNFLKHYYDVEKVVNNPKVFVKYGQAHAKKIISNGAYDLGYFLNNLSKKNGTKTTTINSWNRYYLSNEGKTIDYANNKRYKRLLPFINLGEKDSWVIIDLKSIKEDIKNNKVTLPTNGDYHIINELINSYDYQLIIPSDKHVTYNVQF